MRTKSTLMERMLHFSMTSVSSEKLETGINTFHEQLSANGLYKNLDYSTNQTWSYSLAEGKDGGPVLVNRTAYPEHIFWEQPPDDKHTPAWRLKASSDEILFNYMKNTLDDSGSWADFISTACTLIPMLRQALNIQIWKSIVVTYYFTYSSQTIEDRTLAKDDWIEVMDLLQPFRVMPHSDGFESYCPTYLWEQSWMCRRNENLYRIYSRLDANHAMKPAKSQPLEIHLYMSVAPLDSLVKNKFDIPWDALFSLLKDNYFSMLTDKSSHILAGDFK